MPYAALRNMSLTAPGFSRVSHQAVSHAGWSRSGISRSVSGLTALTVASQRPEHLPMRCTVVTSGTKADHRCGGSAGFTLESSPGFPLIHPANLPGGNLHTAAIINHFSVIRTPRLHVTVAKCQGIPSYPPPQEQESSQYCVARKATLCLTGFPFSREWDREHVREHRHHTTSSEAGVQSNSVSPAGRPLVSLDSRFHGNGIGGMSVNTATIPLPRKRESSQIQCRP